MTSSIIDLGRVLLIDSADKLKLSAVCTASFQLPYFVSTLDHAEILHAFKSGHICTTRGIGCSLDINVLSDGKSLDITAWDALLDKLGRHLLDTKVTSISAGTIHC
jgi:hypothetical protein